MTLSNFKLTSLEITNLKNVKHGVINFDIKNREDANVTGIYGQNGSGKSAVINALLILKNVLNGNSLSEKYIDLINIDSNFAKLKFEFEFDCENGIKYHVEYGFKLSKAAIDPGNEMLSTEIPVIDDEILKAYYENEGEKKRLETIIDTSISSKYPFTPSSKYKLLMGSSEKTCYYLEAAKEFAKNHSTSFIFCNDFLNQLKKHNNNKQGIYVNLIESLYFFGKTKLFVLDTGNYNNVSRYSQSLIYSHEENNRINFGFFSLPIKEPGTVPKRIFDIAVTLINNMNIVLQQLVPGMTVKIEKLDEFENEKNETIVKIKLSSVRNDKCIPLWCESDGIKKIISILQLLITVYNDARMIIAIDEMDNGIFEYLLGELLSIISQNGRGQLIFTSHNLRPLELLDKNSLIFTTTDPQNRYARMKNLKSNNNVRDSYYRSIILDTQNVPLYDETNTYEIAFAFREAGEFSWQPESFRSAFCFSY